MTSSAHRRALLRLAIALVVTASSAISTAHAHYWHRVTSHFADRSTLQQTIDDLAQNHVDIDATAATASGEWIVVASGTITASGGFPSAVKNTVFGYLGQGLPIDAIALTPSGGYAVAAGASFTLSSDVPRRTQLQDKLNAWAGAARRVRDIAFTANGSGWVAVNDAGDVAVQYVGADMYAALMDHIDSGRTVNNVEISADGRWIVTADQWHASSSITSSMADGLNSFAVDKRRIDRVLLGAQGDHLLYSHGTYSPGSTKIGEIEYGLAEGANIFARLDALGVPGVSIAVIENHRVAVARGYGTLDAGKEEAVLASSPFDAASLSKFVGSLGVAKLVERGLIEYGDSINALADRYDGPLRMWRDAMEADPDRYDVADADLPDGVTIERLLSHTASMVPHGSTGFVPGLGLPDENTTTLDLLLGYHCNVLCSYGGGRAVWYDPNIGDPGTAYKYAGGGFLLLDAVSEAASSTVQASYLEKAVLQPLGMADSTVTQPLEASFAARAAEHHLGNVRIPRVVYPWKSAGGLFTPPKDYAKAMIVIMDEGYAATGQRFLQADTVAEILRDRVPGSGRYGLGVGLSRNQVDETGGTFSHSGAHEGAASKMLGSPSRGEGIVIMVDSNQSGEGPSGADTLMGEIVTAFKCAYGWTTTGCS